MRTMQEMRRTFQIRSQAMNERRRRFRLYCLRDAIGGRKGFGLNEVIGIAAGIIIAVVVVIPGLQGFAGDILENLTDWWNDMASTVFATP